MLTRPRCWLLLAALTLPAAAPPPAVTVQTVQVRDVSPVNTYPGSVQPIQTVTILARVQAYINKVDFTEGSMVKAGQTLFELDSAPYEAALVQAQGSQQQYQATLWSAELDYQRDSHAGVGLAVTQQKVQQDQAARDVAAAQLQSAKGAVMAAGLNVGYCTIASPIDGRIGRAQFTQGNLVGPSTGALATVVQMDPIRVTFAVTDSELVTFEQRAGKSRAQMAASLELQLRLPNGTTYAHPGRIEFINNQIDAATGTLTIWGKFDNPDSLLTPGAYVTVEVRQGKPDDHPLVPVQSVQNDAAGQFVLLVGKDDKVRQQRVTTGRQIGQYYIIEHGLSGGERVITEGVQKAHEGQTVQPSEAAPSMAANGAAH